MRRATIARATRARASDAAGSLGRGRGQRTIETEQNAYAKHDIAAFRPTWFGSAAGGFIAIADTVAARPSTLLGSFF